MSRPPVADGGEKPVSLSKKDSFLGRVHRQLPAVASFLRVFIIALCHMVRPGIGRRMWLFTSSRTLSGTIGGEAQLASLAKDGWTGGVPS